MTAKFPPIRKAAVLGAGVMGAQIAAHLANANVPVVLFELAADGDDPRAMVNGAINRLAKLKPAPLAAPDRADHIQPATYTHDLELLGDCDLVIEAIAERMDWKKDLYEQVVPHLKDDAIFATNTSGLSIESLAEVMSDSVQDRFCGVHFFNPPRYMHLAELIPGPETDAAVLDRLEEFLVTGLGKGVVRAKDTPNFIGNRIGVFSMLSAMYHTEQFDLGFDIVDQLTGPLIGRPKSATYRTADVVGLDTMGHVIKTMADTLENDPWHRYFTPPEWLTALINAGQLGQKSGAGFYKKEGRNILVLDRASGDYRASDTQADAQVIDILKDRDPVSRFARLRASDHPQAQFVWACFRDLFHYCAYHLADVADSARAVDLAMRWGYGYKQGPFESWQAAGWEQVAEWVREDIEAGRAMASAPLPAWVDEIPGAHRDGKAWSAQDASWIDRSDLPAYRRQPFPDALIGEQFDRGNTLHEDDSVRIWNLDEDVAILSFKTKMHTVSPGVIEGMNRAIDIAESQFGGLVIWQPSEPFCAGADLAAAGEKLKREGGEGLGQMIHDFQLANLRMKRAQVPVVAGVRGMALGGGCEVLLYCDRVVAALESYIGLVEVGVGLLPAGGGLAEMAARAAEQHHGTDLFAHLQPFFTNIAMGKVSGSAREAVAMGYLRSSDVIVMNSFEVLHVAMAQARALMQSGYRPALADKIEVAGRIGVANLKMMLVNMLEGRFISEHDYNIGCRIAAAICGGDIERGSKVDYQWLFDLERKHFVELAMSEPTQERIGHMLKTGKPLRN